MRKKAATVPILREDMMPEACPLKDNNLGHSYQLFEAMEALRTQHQDRTYLFLFYTKCPLCHTDEGEPLYHWSVFSADQVRWARAIDPFFLRDYGRDDEPGIFRVDLNTMYRLYRHREWLESVSGWMAEHPYPPYFNEWQTPTEAP